MKQTDDITTCEIHSRTQHVYIYVQVCSWTNINQEKWKQQACNMPTTNNPILHSRRHRWHCCNVKMKRPADTTCGICPSIQQACVICVYVRYDMQLSTQKYRWKQQALNMHAKVNNPTKHSRPHHHWNCSAMKKKRLPTTPRLMEYHYLSIQQDIIMPVYDTWYASAFRRHSSSHKYPRQIFENRISLYRQRTRHSEEHNITIAKNIINILHETHK